VEDKETRSLAFEQQVYVICGEKDLSLFFYLLCVFDLRSVSPALPCFFNRSLSGHSVHASPWQLSFVYVYVCLYFLMCVLLGTVCMLVVHRSLFTHAEGVHAYTHNHLLKKVVVT
jgi:hypothetical protein